MKIFLIVGGIITAVLMYIFIFACCKAASNADEAMGYDYLTEEDWEVM